MCRKVTCSQCNKPTWTGCGRHIEEALAGIPVDKRCKCPRSSESNCVISNNATS